jgi:hypothetical protein
MRKAVYAAFMGLVFLLTLTAWGQTGPGGSNSGGGSAGVTWTAPVSKDLNAVAYGNGLFVAVRGVGILAPLALLLSLVLHFFVRPRPSPHTALKVPGYLS